MTIGNNQIIFTFEVIQDALQDVKRQFYHALAVREATTNDDDWIRRSWRVLFNLKEYFRLKNELKKIEEEPADTGP